MQKRTKQQIGFCQLFDIKRRLIVMGEYSNSEKVSRAEKYRDLHDSLLTDNENLVRTPALKPYEERIKRVNPNILDQNTAVLDDLNTILNDINRITESQNQSQKEQLAPRQDQTLQVYSQRGSEKTANAYEYEAQPEYREERQERKKPDTTVIPFQTGKKKRKAAKIEKRMVSREELRNEVRHERRAEPDEYRQSAPAADYPKQKMRELPDSEPKHRRMETEEVNEEAEPAVAEQTETSRLINILLWVLIAVLSVILFAVIYQIFTK